MKRAIVTVLATAVGLVVMLGVWAGGAYAQTATATPAPTATPTPVPVSTPVITSTCDCTTITTPVACVNYCYVPKSCSGKFHVQALYVYNGGDPTTPGGWVVPAGVLGGVTPPTHTFDKELWLNISSPGAPVMMQYSAANSRWQVCPMVTLGPPATQYSPGVP